MDYRWFRPENIKSVPEMLKTSADKYGNKTALIYFSKKISYQRLWDLTERTAGLVSQNTLLGERVAIFMPNIPQFTFCYYGTLRAGRIAVPINFISLANELRSRPTDQIKVTEEISAQLEDSRPSLIFVADFFYPILAQVKTGWPPPKIVVVSPGDFLPFPLNWLYPYKAKKDGKYTGPFPEDVVAFNSAIAETEPYQGSYPNATSVAQFQYTGGTTGIPKGAMLTHRNLASNILQGREKLGNLLEDGAEVTLGALPFFHIYGLTVAMNTTLLSLGGTLVLMPAFNPKDAVKNIEKHKITLFPGVNRMYQALVNHLESAETANISSLKLCVSGAGSIDRSLCDRFKKLSGTEIIEGYGLSETSPIVSITLPSDMEKPRLTRGNLIGSPVPGTEVRLLGDNGQEVAPGETGMITVRGPQIMKGYYNKPEATAEVLENGWFKTGDMGCLDSYGRLYFMDRIKDLIKRRGENIYASQIEKHLSTHPMVTEAAVVGVPDAKDGETPIACVVRKHQTGQDGSDDETAKAIIAYMRQNAPPLQVPSKIVFFSSLDDFKNPIGKVLKRKLKEEVLRTIK